MPVSYLSVVACGLTNHDIVGYTKTGTITVRCALYVKSDFRHGPEQEVVEFAVADTGCGIAPLKLESIFREFEHVSTSERKTSQDSGVGASCTQTF